MTRPVLLVINIYYMEVILMLCPQTVTVGSGQTVGFRSQQGEIYGKGTKCRVNFKVSTAVVSE